MTSLLEPDFVRRLEGLRLLARRRFAGAAGGVRRSTRRGASAELKDYRPYVPGDDVRRIDWNAYARLEELVLRLFVAEEDLVVYLLVDTSRSLAVGAPPKIDVAKRVAAAIGYMALAGSERVSVVPFADTVGRTMPPARGKRRVGTLLRHLSALDCDGRTDLGRSVEVFLSRSPRPGLVFLASDLLDPGGYQRPLERLLSERFEVVLFHVLDPEEISPALGGDLLLVDAETDARVPVSLDAVTVRAYRARVEAFLAEARDWSRRRGVTYVTVRGDMPFEEALLAYLGAPS